MESGSTPIGSPSMTGSEQIDESTPLLIRDAPEFSPAEHQVLQTLAGVPSLTAGQLRVQTGLTQDDLTVALESLRAKGLVAALNTVVESYRSRFPGVSLGAE